MSDVEALRREVKQTRRRLEALKRERDALLRRQRKKMPRPVRWITKGTSKKTPWKNNILTRRAARVAKRGPHQRPGPYSGKSLHIDATNVLKRPMRVPGWLVSYSGMKLVRE